MLQITSRDPRSFRWRRLVSHLSRCRADDLSYAAGLLDFLRSRFRKNVGFHFDFAGDVAGSENLESIAQLLDDAQLHQTVGRKRIARQLFEITQIHDGEFLLEKMGEAALRQTAMERHLAAFKAAHDAVARNGARALMSAGRRLTAAV